MRTMQVEEGERFYFVDTGIEAYGMTYEVLIKKIGGEWTVLLPSRRLVNETLLYLTGGEARALGRALILAADWVFERNQKERGCE